MDNNDQNINTMNLLYELKLIWDIKKSTKIGPMLIKMELTVINIFLTFVMNEVLLEPNLHPAELEINQWKRSWQNIDSSFCLQEVKENPERIEGINLSSPGWMNGLIDLC
jgi:hypothetical protein